MQLDQTQIQTYLRFADLALPRHTSYPAANHWDATPDPLLYRTAVAASLGEGRDLSLYVHIPFCRQLCLYCACTKQIVPDEKQVAAAEVFLQGSEREVFHRRPPHPCGRVRPQIEIVTAAELVSHLMFEPAYTKRLIDLGRKDAEAHREELVAFLCD